MLAELAAANAAFAVIKTAVQNGKEIAAAGSAIAEFVGAKETLEKKANKKGGGNDLEEFMALEKIRQQKEQLRSMMRLYGRPGLYDSYVEFCAKARKARKEAAAQREKERQELMEILTWIFVVVVVWGGIAYGIYWWFF